MYVLNYLTGTRVYIAVGGVNIQIVHLAMVISRGKNKHNKYAVHINGDLCLSFDSINNTMH